MVKNAGGNKNKGVARKYANKTTTSISQILDLLKDPYVVIAVVTKMNGNNCSIMTNDNLTLVGHIRGNMRGRSMRKNFISTHSFVLVQKRDWETTPKNCDVVHVLSATEISTLSSMPSIDISMLQRAIQSVATSTDIDTTDDFVFSNKISVNIEPSVEIADIELNPEEIINIDDI
jgi:translation initiation factor IF-1